MKQPQNPTEWLQLSQHLTTAIHLLHYLDDCLLEPHQVQQTAHALAKLQNHCLDNHRRHLKQAC